MNYVGLEQQGFWKPFEYLGAMLANNRARRDKLSQLEKENRRADLSSDLNKQSVESQLATSGLEREGKNLDLALGKRKKELMEFNPGAEISASVTPPAIGPQPSVPVDSNPNGTLDIAGAGKSLDDVGAPPVGPIAPKQTPPDFSKPFHEQAPEVQQAYQKFAAAHKFTLPEVTGAHNAAYTAQTGKPVVPQIDLNANPLTKGMAPYSATVGPDGGAQVNVLNPANYQGAGAGEGQVIRGENNEPLLKLLTTTDPKTGLPIRSWHNVEAGNRKQLSEDMSKELEAYPNILNRLEKLQNSHETLSKKFFGTGPVAGRLTAVKQHAIPGPEAAEFEQNLHLLQDLVPKTLSGNTGKMAQGEIDRYLATLPTLHDPTDVVQKKIENLRNTVIDSYKTRKTMLDNTGYRTSGIPTGMGLDTPQVTAPGAASAAPAPSASSASRFNSPEEAIASVGNLAPGSVFEVLDPSTGKYLKYKKD